MTLLTIIAALTFRKRIRPTSVAKAVKKVSILTVNITSPRRTRIPVSTQNRLHCTLYNLPKVENEFFDLINKNNLFIV